MTVINFFLSLQNTITAKHELDYNLDQGKKLHRNKQISLGLQTWVLSKRFKSSALFSTYCKSFRAVLYESLSVGINYYKYRYKMFPLMSRHAEDREYIFLGA